MANLIASDPHAPIEAARNGKITPYWRPAETKQTPSVQKRGCQAAPGSARKIR